jgi:hypothetical protein
MYVLLLLNACYFEIPSFLTEGLSFDTTFHLGSTVNTKMQPGMIAATVHKWRAGRSREEQLRLMKDELERI